MSTINTTNELGHFVVHLHGACTHRYEGESLDGLWLNDEYSGADDQGWWYMVLIHPRWCPNCIRNRNEIIYLRYQQRLDVMAKSNAHEENVRIELSYLRGVRDGRIDSLSISFNKGPCWEDKAKAGEDVGEVSELMEELRVGRQVKGPTEIAEELAAMMGGSNLGPDKLSEEILLWFKDEEAYKCGVKEGMIEQLRLEWNALCAGNGTRDEMFAMALV